jgi:hypothetical protein
VLRIKMPRRRSPQVDLQEDLQEDLREIALQLAMAAIKSA